MFRKKANMTTQTVEIVSGISSLCSHLLVFADEALEFVCFITPH